MVTLGQGRPPLIEARAISKRFGPVTALANVDLRVEHQQVHALLGDNGAGKSTLIQILNGVLAPTGGALLWEGRHVRLRSPRDAMALGISVVFQDLAIVPQLSIYRNLFLGREREVSRRVGPLSFLNVDLARRRTADALAEIGIAVRDPGEPVGYLSGGERQSIAIARAVYFESSLLIMDEPTSALSLKETAKVLLYIEQARAKGVSVLVITHNVNNIYPLADCFTVLAHGRSLGTFRKEDVRIEQLAAMIHG